jgi:hypothetical protein
LACSSSSALSSPAIAAASAAARFSLASRSVALSRMSAAVRSSPRAFTSSSWRCREATRSASAPLASLDAPGSSMLATIFPPPLEESDTGCLLLEELLLLLLLVEKPERPSPGVAALGLEAVEPRVLLPGLPPLVGCAGPPRK